MIAPSYTAILLFVLAPGLVFSLALLEPIPAALAAALSAASVATTLARTDWRMRPDWLLLGGATSVAAFLTLVSGVGHLVYQTDDWTVRDALLLDLVRYPWPIPYALDSFSGVLRAPIGMYLVPALVGKAFGAGAAEAALFAQNTALMALCFYVFARTAVFGRARWIVLGLFVIFSGLDCLAWAKRLYDGTPDNLLLPHLDPWPGFFQFSSHVTQVLWVPHHALAGWTFIAAYQAWRTGRLPALLICPLWALTILWSTLPAFGAIPFLLFALASDLRDGKIRIGDFVSAALAGLGVLPVVIYITRDTAGLPQGFLDFTNMTVVQSYVAMMLVKVAPWLALAWEARDRKDGRTRWELAIIALVLAILPIYKIGIANDFVMRASIPALALLCLRAAPAFATLGAQPIRQRVLAVAIVVLGAVTPAVEIARNITGKAEAASVCNVWESLEDGPAAGTPRDYYIASDKSMAVIPHLFRQPSSQPKTLRVHECWPGRSFVYRRPGT